MMNQISESNRIIRQLSEFYSEDNWVTINFKTKVLSLSAEKALMEVPGHTHTIARQVAHMLAWRNFALQKLTGNNDYGIIDNSLEDWPEVNHWETLVEKFDECHFNIVQAIQKFPPGKWDHKVPLRDYTFMYLINGILEHDYYHYGQIGSILAEIKRLT